MSVVRFRFALLGQGLLALGMIAAPFGGGASVRGAAEEDEYRHAGVFESPIPQQGANSFGREIAADGNLLVVAEHAREVGRRVHVFDAVTGDVLHTLISPAPEMDTTFGRAVACDGNRVIVSVTHDKRPVEDVGRVYVFDADTGQLLRRIDDPTPSEGGHFGAALAAHDGKLIVGNPYDQASGPKDGTAYIFEVETGKLLHTLTNPQRGSQSSFGTAVDLHDGRAIVGAYFLTPAEQGDVYGQAYIYDVATGKLLQTLDPPPSKDGYEYFGKTLAIHGPIAAVEHDRSTRGKTGLVHIHATETGERLLTIEDPQARPHASYGDEFGASLALVGDRLLVGAPQDMAHGYAAGQAHLFDLPTGRLIAALDVPNSRGAKSFGAGVALTGGRMFVGAPAGLGSGWGMVHLFEGPAPEALVWPTPQPRPEPEAQPEPDQAGEAAQEPAPLVEAEVPAATKTRSSAWLWLVVAGFGGTVFVIVIVLLTRGRR